MQGSIIATGSKKFASERWTHSTILLVSIIASVYGHRTQMWARISLNFICCGRISHECVANLKRFGHRSRGMELNWIHVEGERTVAKISVGRQSLSYYLHSVLSPWLFLSCRIGNKYLRKEFLSSREGLGTTRGKEGVVSNNFSREQANYPFTAKKCELNLVASYHIPTEIESIARQTFSRNILAFRGKE